MKDQELRDLVAENSRSITRMEQEGEKSRKNGETRRKELDKQLEKVGREIGWIGNTFGRFTEGLFLPSLETILLEEFGLDTTAPRIMRRKNGSSIEIDVLGFSNGNANTAIVVEIKSKLRDADIKEFLQTLKIFPDFFQEHQDKKIFGMVAAVNISTEQKKKLENLGIYVVQINDDVFCVVSAKKFEPNDFALKA